MVESVQISSHAFFLPSIGDPSPRVLWRLNGRLLDAEYESTMVGEVSNTLVIERLGRQHLHAPLRCEASNTNDSRPVTALVTIEMNREYQCYLEARMTLQLSQLSGMTHIIDPLFGSVRHYLINQALHNSIMLYKIPEIIKFQFLQCFCIVCYIINF